MQSYVIETAAGKVEYTDIGKGLPILFFHGGHANCFDTLAQKGLSPQKYRFITPSRPGYGGTPLLSESTPESTARLMSALLDALDIKQCFAYGISAGGPSALALATFYPQKVTGLVLASAVSKAWLSPRDGAYRTAKQIFDPRFEKFTWMVVRTFGKLMPGIMAASFFKEFSSSHHTDFPPEDAAELLAILNMYRSGKGFVNDLDQSVEAKILQQITRSTLIIHSRYDQSVSLEHAEFAHSQIENSQLHVLDNAWGHMLWIGIEYQKVASLVDNFIKQRVQSS